MIIGVPKEIKTGEQRVALAPAGVHALVDRGHRVLVESGAGTSSGIRDDEYAQVGAVLHPAPGIWADADVVLKVKEPIPAEYSLLRSEQTLFTYLHLAAVPQLTRALQQAGTTAIAHRVAALTAAGRLMSVAGGGDTLAALADAGVLDQLSYVSTAGGAFLEWLEGKELPGVAVLRRGA